MSCDNKWYILTPRHLNAETKHVKHSTYHRLSLAEISLVVCDKEEKAESLLVNKENGVTPTLSCLVLFNPVSAALVERGRNCGVEILQLEQLMVRK